MIRITSRSALIVAFSISFVALIFNAFILADVNSRLESTDAEYTKLVEALRVQTDQGNTAETKFQNYRMMYHLVNMVPEKNRADARDDASIMLEDALIYLYVAANDLSMSDVRRHESEEFLSEEVDAAYQKIKDGTKKVDYSNDEPTGTEILDSALKILEKKEVPANDTELSEKLAAINIVSEAATEAKDETEFLVRLYPVGKALNAKWVESVKAKQARMQELELQRRRLTTTQSYCTFGALALQMLGLAFVFLKDFLK